MNKFKVGDKVKVFGINTVVEKYDYSTLYSRYYYWFREKNKKLCIEEEDYVHIRN